MSSSERMQKRLNRATQRIAILESMIEEKTRQLYLDAELLEEANSHLNTILGTMMSGLVVVDSNLLITTANPAISKLLGYEDGELLGQPITKVIPVEHLPEFVDETAGQFTKNSIGEVSCFTKERKPIRMLLSEAIIPHDGGECSGAVLVFHDLTQYKSMERQLMEAQKLESVGRLAAGIAHEINTPVQYVGDNTRFLSDAFKDFKKVIDEFSGVLELKQNGEVPEEAFEKVKATIDEVDIDYLVEEVPSAIEQTIDGVNRVAKIVRAMKEFSHPGSEEKQAVDLNQLIESTATVSTNEWKYVADLSCDLEDSLPAVPCLPAEFNQVLLNLIVNAAHAISSVTNNGRNGKGEIQISTRTVDKWAEVAIRDTGGGIPDEIAKFIFEPFFTTKEVGVGTGQGLAIARSMIVDKHGGELFFDSEIGVGTTFFIRIPLQESTATNDD